MEIKPQINPGRKDDLSQSVRLRHSLGWILWMYSLLIVDAWIFCTKRQKMTPGNNLKTAWFHSVPNKRLCAHLWRIIQEQLPCECFHLSKSLLAEEGGVRRLSSSVFFSASKCCVLGEPATSRCRQWLVDDPQANNKIEVFTPLLSHALCLKKKDCCRAVESASQLHYI